MLALNPRILNFDWRDLSPDSAGDFAQWSAAKCHELERLSGLDPVPVSAFAAPSAESVAQIKRRCALANYAVYALDTPGNSLDETSAGLLDFARAFGLRIAEDHRSAGHAGVVALRRSEAESQRGYIPYTPRPLNWHTDGYYNPPETPVYAFVLHCLRPAASGGENQLIDPEVAYMRLRAENPDYVQALMHPEAMTIPENREADGSVRPASVGPVFFPDPVSGRLQMRYTARTRSIAWRDDPLTQAASDWLRGWLTAGDPLMAGLRLDAGQGILNNNVLHNRTGFEDGPTPEDARVILRLRFHNRIAEETNGTA